MSTVNIANPVRIIKQGEMSDFTKAVRYFTGKGRAYKYKSPAVIKLLRDGFPALTKDEKDAVVAQYKKTIAKYRRKVGNRANNYKEILITNEDDYDL